MMKAKPQKGFAHLALVLLVVIVAIIAFAGYQVVKNRQNKTAANVTSTALSPKAQSIETKADLDKATNTLNGQPVDSDLNPDDLNDDVSNLL